LSIDIYIDTKTDIDTSFKFVFTILIVKVAKNIFRASTIGKNIFVFRKLEKTAIKNCRKKNTVLLLSIFASKYTEDSVLVTKDNYILKIAETVTIESIDTILKNRIFRKTEFNLKKFDLVVKKQKIQ